MKYLILIYGNPTSCKMFEGLSHAERLEGLSIYAALREDLQESGEFIVSEALADSSLTRRVTVHDGQMMTTESDPAVAGHHRVAAVRAHLLDLAGDHEGAYTHYRLAASRTLNIPEQRYLESRAARLTRAG